MAILMIQTEIYSPKSQQFYFCWSAYVAKRVGFPIIMLMAKKKSLFDTTVWRLVTLGVNVTGLRQDENKLFISRTRSH